MKKVVFILLSLIILLLCVSSFKIWSSYLLWFFEREAILNTVDQYLQSMRNGDTKTAYNLYATQKKAIYPLTEFVGDYRDTIFNYSEYEKFDLLGFMFSPELPFQMNPTPNLIVEVDGSPVYQDNHIGSLTAFLEKENGRWQILYIGVVAQKDIDACSNQSPLEKSRFSAGLTIDGITIGTTSVDEVEALMGEPKYKGSFYELGSVPACRYTYFDLDSSYYRTITLIEGRVYKYGISSAGFLDKSKGVPTRLFDAVTIYGIPNFVKFGSDYNYRAVIWINKGVMAYVYANELSAQKTGTLKASEARISSITFFPPMSEADYWSYPPIDVARKTPTPALTGNVPENPFIFDQ